MYASCRTNGTREINLNGDDDRGELSVAKREADHNGRTERQTETPLPNIHLMRRKVRAWTTAIDPEEDEEG